MNIPLVIAPPNPQLHKEYIDCENGTICRCPLTIRDQGVIGMVVLEESSPELREFIDRHLAAWPNRPEGIVTAMRSPLRCCQIDVAFYPLVDRSVLPVGVHIGSNILGLVKMKV